MEPLEPQIHSFIIKIWLEANENMPGSLVWRGYITHVPTANRRYLKSLNEIVPFIESTLNELGFKIPHKLRFWRWLVHNWRSFWWARQ